MTRWVSIDAASITAGWALWDDDRLIGWGIWQEKKGSAWERIHSLVSQCRLFVAQEDIQEAAIEDPVPPRGTSQKALLHSVGALYAACYPLKPVMINTSTMRRAVNMFGNASKEDMQTAITAIYHCDEAPSDAKDAIAVGHAYKGIRQLRNIEVIE